MITWIDTRLALAIYDRQISEHGGSPDLRDENLLESVLANPQQLHDNVNQSSDLADLAASLASGFVKNHPFVDSNKRMAHVLYRTFIELNDAALIATPEEKYISILSLAEGRLSVEEFAVWLREHIRIRPRNRIQERRKA